MEPQLWCSEAENFVEALADSYYRARRKLAGGDITLLGLAVLQMYWAYRDHNLLPGNPRKGYSGQNPTLMYAFRRLQQVDVRVQREESETV